MGKDKGGGYNHPAPKPAAGVFDRGRVETPWCMAQHAWNHATMVPELSPYWLRLFPHAHTHTHIHKHPPPTTHARTNAGTHTRRHTHTQEEDEEEMQSPGRVHPRPRPMVPASPHRLGTAADGVTPVGLNGLSTMALSSSSPPHRKLNPRNTLAVHVVGTTWAPTEGGEVGATAPLPVQPATPLGSGLRRTGVSP